MKSIPLALLAAVLFGCAPAPRVVKTAPPISKAFGYRVAAGNVVFEFQPGEYHDVTSGTTPKWSTLSALRVHSVAVAGEFNRWSITALPMVLSGDHWVTTQPMSMFDPERPQAFKFVVNSEYWVEPPPEAMNRLVVPKSRQSNLLLDLHRAEPAAAPSR